MWRNVSPVNLFWHYGKTLFKLLLRRPLPGVTLIPLLPDGRIVLVQRRDTGQWSLPGGLIDWGETITETASRELAEETGLQLLAIERLLGVYSSPERDPRLHSVTVSLAIRVEGKFLVGDYQEILAVQAFKRSEIPLENLSHDHGQQLKNFFENTESGVVM